MDLAVTLLVLVLYSALLTYKGKLNASLAPLVVMSGEILLLLIFGILDLLVAGVWVIYAGALLTGFYLVVKERQHWKEILSSLFQPGMVFFLGISIYFWWLMWKIQAGFRVWDEFSFWGTACKAVFENRRLYTLFPSSMINISYPPGLALNSFFLQFLSPFFEEWKTYTAYNMLAMATVAPLFSRLRWKNPLGIVLTTGFCFFGIYEFFYGLDGLVAYANSYADWIVGYCFAGALLIWFCQEEKNGVHFVGTLLSLMLMPIIRDIGLALGLVAGGMIAFDQFVFPAHEEGVRFWEGWGKRLVKGIVFLACVPASYLTWTLHFNRAAKMERVTIGYPYSMVDMLLGKDPHALEVWANMREAFHVRQIVNFATPAGMVVVFTVLALVLAVLAKERRNKGRIVCFALLHVFGFLVYSLFQTYTYTAIFDSASGLSLICYERYMSSYVFGWYFSLLGLGASVVAEPYPFFGEEGFVANRWKLAPGLLTIAVALWSVFHYLPYPMHSMCVAHQLVQVQRTELLDLVEKQQQKYREILTSDKRVYVIAQRSSGGEWFLANYALMPAYTVKTFGGGYFVDEEKMSRRDEDAVLGRYYTVAHPDNFSEFLRKNEVDFIYLFAVDEYIYQEFAQMFTDGMEGYSDGSTYLYAVHDLGDRMEFVPFFSSEHYRELVESWGTT